LLQGIEIGLETDEIGPRPLVAAALFQLGDLRLNTGFFARVLEYVPASFGLPLWR
jgi:hypothetical protein